jgi:hypothetical protein
LRIPASPENTPSTADLVAAGLESGVLWILEASPVWAGHGLQKPCIVCRQRINRYEIQYDVPGPRGALPTHATCHSVWRAISDGMLNKPRSKAG